MGQASPSKDTSPAFVHLQGEVLKLQGKTLDEVNLFFLENASLVDQLHPGEYNYLFRMVERMPIN